MAKKNSASVTANGHKGKAGRKRATIHPDFQGPSMDELMQALLGDQSGPSSDSSADRPSDDVIRRVAEYIINAAETMGVTGPSAKPVFSLSKVAGKTNPTAEHVLEFGNLLSHVFSVDQLAIQHQMGEAFKTVGNWLISLAQSKGATGKDRNSIYTDGKPVTPSNGGPQAGWEMAQFLLSLVGPGSDADNSDQDMDIDEESAGIDVTAPSLVA